MKSIKRITAYLLAIALVIGGAAGVVNMVRPAHTHAQYGASLPIGFAAASVNIFPPTSATGVAGAVTNTSGFLMLVTGGPIYCFGALDTMAQSNITLAANTTYLIVYNCIQGFMYAKTGVTAPGSSGTSTGGNPPPPTSLLFAVPGLEVPLATVVCGASTCGTITDSRPLGSFPSGTFVGGHLNQAAAGTTTGGAGTGPDAAGICTATAATTCVVTFSNAYQATPVCTVTDQTNAIVFKALPTTTNLTITAASNSDTWSWMCMGNPN